MSVAGRSMPVISFQRKFPNKPRRNWAASSDDGHRSIRQIDALETVAACPLRSRSGQANACLSMSASCHPRPEGLFDDRDATPRLAAAGHTFYLSETVE